MEKVDLIRASLDGHAFHHAWAARSALELLPTTTDLQLISIEGFPKDEEGLSPSDASDEVADLVRFRGGRTSKTASRIEVVQFKYSIAKAAEPMRAVAAGKTIKKFAAAFEDYVKELGFDRASQIVRFELVTNRPIAPELTDGLAGLQQGNTMDGAARDQADAIATACGLDGRELRAFATMLSVLGGRGTLRGSIGGLAKAIASWSSSSDALARTRLIALQRLITDKAGSGGQSNNAVTRVDVLGALEIADERELFPAEAAFPPVERVIARDANNELLLKVDGLASPLLVHGVGGMGKTVLMQSLADRLAESNLVALFDGFGAGRWRDPADGRHLPQRALLQLINQIAAKGLCDLLLPGGTVEDLLRAFRRRLEQATASLRDQGFAGTVVLLLDAIDHSAMQAQATQTHSFAALLLESFSISPIEGVRLVGSCRTERLALTRGDVECELYEVPPFSNAEAHALVLAKYPNATSTDAATAYARSNGNPRILSMVLRQGPPFEVSRVGPKPSLTEALDELIAEQVQAARRNAKSLGAADAQIDAVLAGLSLLPPPVPVEELAAAQGVQAEAIQSFVADLFPLIEQTPYGLIFRDEPTETFVRKRADQDVASQEEVLRRLDDRQEVSNYAARTLPAVLRELGRKAQLFALAFIDRLPATATSGVAQRAIRLARLEAALHVAGKEGETDKLMALTLELARISEGYGRSDRYIRDNPDLIAIAADPEALRRLFEDRGNWPGARHASLAVANLMEDDNDEAWRNARRSLEWHDWRVRQIDGGKQRLPNTRQLDVYGPAWVAVALGRQRIVGEWLLRWEPAAGFAYAVEIVRLLEEHACISDKAAKRRDQLYQELGRIKQPATIYLLAVLTRSRSLSSGLRDRLVSKLVSASDLPNANTQTDDRDGLEGLTQAFVDVAMREVLAGRKAAAALLIDRASLNRPRIYVFDGVGRSWGEMSRWLLAGLVRATARGHDISIMDVAPVEIDNLVRRKIDRKTPVKYMLAVKEGLKVPPPSKRRRPDRKRAIDREGLHRFIDLRISPILTVLADAQEDLRQGKPDAAVKRLLDACDNEFNKLESYPYRDNRGFANRLTSRIAVQIANAMDIIDPATAARVCTYFEGSKYHHLPDESRIVWMLASHAAGASAALKLASAISDKLAAETSVDTRIGQQATLAHAVWPASTAEARSYFMAGLQLADSFSSDDIDETYGLLALAEAYRGPRLTPQTVHDFQRLCEMQMTGDADRYDWRAHSFALARIGGLEGLAIACRLLDRNRGGLKYDHLELCAALVEAEKLSPELAAVLIGVQSYKDWLAFRITDHLGRILPTIDGSHQATVLGYAACEVDRVYAAGIPSEIANGLRAFAVQYLSEQDPLRLRFEQLAVEENHAPDDDSKRGLLDIVFESRSDQSGEEWNLIEAIVAEADIASAAGIDAAVARLPEKHKVGRPTARLLKRLGEGAALPDLQIRFLDAVEQALLVGVEDKLLALDGILPEWMHASAAIRDHVAGWARRLCARHARDLAKSGWGGSHCQNRLIAICDGAITSGEIAALVLKHLDGQLGEMDRKSWLGLARQLTLSASSQSLGDGLSRYVRLAAKAIPDEFADGPWSTGFEVSDDQSAVVAGVIWSQLGSPNARTRWRAAHAVRRSVELNQPEVVEHLMGRIHSMDAGAFQDRSTNFFFLNAKLWLMLAMARIALDQPDRVVTYRQILEEIAFSTDLPHVLMRELARRILSSISICLPKTDGEALRKRCKLVNAHALKPERRDHYYGADFYGKVPDGYTRREPEFHFEYDFAKYRLVGLAEIFGSHQYETGDKVAAWVHRWSPGATNMWSGRGEDFDEWSGGRKPMLEGWNGHLAWHGLFLAAGEMLLTHRIVTTEWDRHPWKNWLSNELLSREDGRWLADDTSLTPVDIGSELTGGRDLPVPARSIELLPLANPDYLGPEWLVVDGMWDAKDGFDVTVSSALVPEADLSDAVLTLALLSQFDVWLPKRRHEDRFHVEMRPFQAWLDEVERARESGIDQSDPYGIRTARDDVIPVPDLVRDAGLYSLSPYHRIWSDGAAAKFRTEAWGRMSGSGRDKSEIRGRRALAHRSLIQQACASVGGSLVILIFTRRYMEGKHGDAAFPSRWLLVVVGPDGKPQPVVRIPTAVRRAVKAMAEHPRPEFKRALKVVRSARRANARSRRKA
ncbi:NACHT domain-containing protein [Mesorhizobium sp. VK22B]|uniref:NACHT domain-containing protein n=1 Tax=Mesorhizobium captivum TaxID=3072319 RepID=A0ABU4ZDQ9_9HYPH|nr:MULTISPECIES: NACHT domain-containing protein [unclassified Mesorhizobium]MDX8496415.1 NACHT domain-containing protein [Mesorhizobium sp. VK22B]MDX8509925.1 NACHT domain-containing protein [Mesorhizobium sp. VK22E]